MDASFRLMQQKKKEKSIKQCNNGSHFREKLWRLFCFFLKWRLDEEADTEQDAVIFTSDLTGERQDGMSLQDGSGAVSQQYFIFIV